MHKDIAHRSHAQNRFLRREDNRAGNHPAKGTPIPGPLTPTEIAHKARRRARRLKKATNACINLPDQINKARKQLTELSTKTDTESINSALTLEHKIARLEAELSRFTRIRLALS